MFTWPSINFLTVFYDMIFEAVRQEFDNLECSVVVQELEIATNRAIYDHSWNLVTNTS